VSAAIRAKIEVRNFGPFEEAEIELKPLTIFVGRNSVGKSMLFYLLWALTVSEPDWHALGEELDRAGVEELARRILDSVSSGRAPVEELRRLVELHLDALPKALARGLEETLRRVFGAELSDMVREGADEARILVEKPAACMELAVSARGVEVVKHSLPRDWVRSIELQLLAPKHVVVRFRAPGGGAESVEERIIDSVPSLAELIASITMDYLIDVFIPFFCTPRILAAMLPDSRAGLARALLRPHPLLSVVREVLYPDAQFVELYYRLAEMAASGSVDLELVNPLLRELGCEIEPRFEAGVYTLYLRMWSGKVLPIYRAPSGIREVLTLALALAARGGPFIVFVEEPEAHLHPAAQRVLAKLVARALRRFKAVVLTSHSDYILYTISNLIAAHHLGEGAREVGIDPEETIDPSNVAAYLIKSDRERRSAAIEPLEVTEEGIPDEEFARVAQELAQERAEILAPR